MGIKIDGRQVLYEGYLRAVKFETEAEQPAYMKDIVESFNAYFEDDPQLNAHKKLENLASNILKNTLMFDRKKNDKIAALLKFLQNKIEKTEAEKFQEKSPKERLKELSDKINERKFLSLMEKEKKKKEKEQKNNEEIEKKDTTALQSLEASTSTHTDEEIKKEFVHPSEKESQLEEKKKQKSSEHNEDIDFASDVSSQEAQEKLQRTDFLKINQLGEQSKKYDAHIEMKKEKVVSMLKEQTSSIISLKKNNKQIERALSKISPLYEETNKLIKVDAQKVFPMQKMQIITEPPATNPPAIQEILKNNEQNAKIIEETNKPLKEKSCCMKCLARFFKPFIIFWKCLKKCFGLEKETKGQTVQNG